MKFVNNLYSDNDDLDISDPNYSDIRRYRIAVFFSCIGALCMLVFVIDDIINAKYSDITLDAGLLFFLLLMPFIVQRFLKPFIWYSLAIFFAVFLMIKLVYSGPSSHGANFVWFLMVPPISFLLLGKYKGMIPSFLTACILVLLLIFPEAVGFELRFPMRYTFHMLTGFFSLTLLTWLYEFDRSNLDISLKKTWSSMQSKKEELRDANDNLSTLIHETNHRISNNLSMIGALIHLYIDSDKTKDQALSQLSEKIAAIGASNRMLYAGGNATEIDMYTYLTDLADQLKETFAAISPEIALDIANIIFPPDKAVNLGLIVNELVTNACKYGISTGGNILVTLKKSDKQIRLSVMNDGNPFPDSVDIQNTESTGFSILRNIAHSLQAEVTLEKSEKTIITVAFSEEV